MKLKTEINHYRWLLTALLLVAAMVVPSVAWAENTINPSKPTTGDGTAESPYEISSKKELYWFAGLVNGDASVCDYNADTNPNGTRKNTSACAKLTADITVNTGVLAAISEQNNSTEFIPWVPIKAYVGTFDGDNHTISGLYFNYNDSEFDKAAGFFKDVWENGKVMNVGIVDSYFNVTLNNGDPNFGGLCGINFGTFTNCFFRGTISLNISGYIGGLCGIIQDTGKFANCYFAGTVFHLSSSSERLYGDNFSGKIKNCYILSSEGNLNEGKTIEQFNSGEVAWLLSKGCTIGETTYDGSTWGQNLGTDGDKYPVLGSEYKVYRGYSGCKLTFSNNENELSQTQTDHTFNNEGFCDGCHAYQPATKNDNGVYEISNAGQLYWFAALVNGDTSQPDIEAQDLSASAILMNDITVNQHVLNANGEFNSGVNFIKWRPIGTDGKQFVGTFDGNNHTISGLYYTTTITKYVGLFGYVGTNGVIKNVGVVDSYIKGRYYVGGLCGFNIGKISNCYNAGTIIGQAQTTIGFCDVGGICGYSKNSITNCYNEGSVIGNAGDVARVGGLVGDWYGNTLSNCYSRGTVSASGDPCYVGGVCGTNGKTITNCYFDSDIYSGNAVGKNLGTGTANVEGKTTAQFKSGEVAWLLNGSTSENPIWHQNIGSGTLDDYPVLDNTHQVVYACTLSEPTHGSLGVTDENNVVLTPTNDKKIFGAKGFKVIITATPEENTNVKYKLKLLKANEDEISTGVGIEIDKDITITAEFELDWFVVGGVKYEVIGFSDKVRVTEHAAPSNELTISETVTYTSDNQSQRFTVTEIADNVYKEKTNLTKVVLPSTLQSIGANAFSGCSSLEDVNFPSTLQSIGENAFYGCSSLGEVEFPSTLESIGASAFSGCSSLATITFNGATPTIGENAFSGVNENVVINVPGLYGESYINAFSENLINKIKTDKALITLFPGSCGKIKVYVVNEDDGNAVLQDIIDNNKVVVDWGKTVKIEAVANSGYGLSWLKIDGEQVRGNSYTTPAPLAGGYVENSKIVGNIKAEASFYYIIPSVFMYDDVCYEKRWDANYWEEVTVRNLNYFYYDKHYTGDLELPEKVEYYGSYYKVTAINERAFSGSSELKSVVLPSVMNKIGSYAFEGCTGLEKLVVKSPSAATRAATTEPTVPTVDEHAFDDICETAVLYVPENWKEAFKAAPEWRKFFEVKEQREDGTVLAELTMTSTYGGKLAVGEIVSESDTRIVKVAEGSSVTVEVTPREGYMLTNLSYDGTDVMDQLVDGKLTLTGISGEKYITAVFGIDTGIGNSGASSQKVYVKDGRIVVDGVAAGEEIFIYNASGQLLHREVANGEMLEIPMTAGQMYIVKIGKKIVKI